MLLISKIFFCFLFFEIIIAKEKIDSTYFSHFEYGIKNIFAEENFIEYQIFASSIIGSSILLDEKLENHFDNKKYFSNNFSNFLDDYFGTKKIPITILSCVLIFGTENMISQKTDSNFYSNTELLLENALTTTLCSEILKNSIYKKRPNNSNNKSFPSGHTAIAFSIATTMNTIYGWKIGIPFFSLASLVAIQRIEQKKHFFFRCIRWCNIRNLYK